MSNYTSMNRKFSRSLRSRSVSSRQNEATAVASGNAGGFKASRPRGAHSPSPSRHPTPERREQRPTAGYKKRRLPERVREKRLTSGNRAASKGSLPSRILRCCLQGPSDWKKTRGNAVMMNPQEPFLTGVLAPHPGTVSHFTCLSPQS